RRCLATEVHMFKSYRFGFTVILFMAIGVLQASAATAAESNGPKTSPAFTDAFREAQNALVEKRWSDVVTKAQEVLASNDRNPDDTYAANYFLLEANRGLRNVPEMR